MLNIFTKHTRAVNETYLNHLWFSIKHGIELWFAGMILILHGFLPFLFENTTSNLVVNLSERLIKRRASSQILKQ